MTIDIDEQLLEDAMTLGNHKSRASAVHAALMEYVRVLRQRETADLFGTVDYDPDYDYKAERSRE